MSDELFAPDFKSEPYWWMAAPRPDVEPEAELPGKADVVIVGSGYTGLSAALTLARANRDVLVLDAGVPGFGASSRNAGYVGKTLKHGFGPLLESLGKSAAMQIYREMQAAFDCVTNLIREEQIECHYQQCGRFMAANSPQHYDSMARELEIKRKHLGDEFEMIPRARQHEVLGSDTFCGGAVIPSLGGLHPGLYHLGLLERVKNSGATVVGNTRVDRIVNRGDTFEVTTERGRVTAKDVFVATNGYTGKETPWLHRRLIPFRGFMIATEELPEDLLQRVFPKSHTNHDYNNNLVYFRRAPDSPRVLFGGLTGTMTDNLRAMVPRLHAKLVETAPALSAAKVSRAWNGFCAGTFDLYPHIGLHDGVRYAMGYCFAGLPMGTYLGHKAARQILGDPEGKTVFSEREFPTKWWYTGTPWFLPIYMAHYNWLDRRGK